jgi:hypothetical protein
MGVSIGAGNDKVILMREGSLLVYCESAGRRPIVGTLDVLAGERQQCDREV